MEAIRYRALVLADDAWGANYLAEDDGSSIRGFFSSLGWEFVTVSAKGEVAPCAYAAGLGIRPFATDLKVGEVGELGGYDALIVLPGRRHEGLVGDPAALELVREAEREGLAVAAFCRGAAVLAAAGILRGRRATAPLDMRAALEAAGARYIGYDDAKGKSDAPPPVVDGNLVTSLRSNYYRGRACEAVRIVAANARAARAGGQARGAPRPAPGAGLDGRAAAPIPACARADARSLGFAFETEDCGKRAFALASSIRRFGGELSSSPILALVPSTTGRVDPASRNALEEFGVEVRVFPMDPVLAAFPLGELPLAAAAAEAELEGRADVLAWLSEDTIVLREPTEFLLPRGTVLGWRPVHHDLVGPRLGEEPDGYWRAVYEVAGADIARAPATVTTVDRKAFRFHANAGMLALRPEAGLLRRWGGLFASSYTDQRISAFYDDPRRRILAHQAFLSAAIIASVHPALMRELSYAYNYPLHLQASVPRELAAKKAEDLVTMRYEDWGTWLGAPDWKAVLPAGGAWAEWAQEMSTRFRA